ncbi:hypothetical protein M758_5G070100 [Ceratodon purpureus]|nr:hypothetical protein M758_5G070100 [Ceratodon purpureus]
MSLSCVLWMFSRFCCGNKLGHKAPQRGLFMCFGVSVSPTDTRSELDFPCTNWVIL